MITNIFFRYLNSNFVSINKSMDNLITNTAGAKFSTGLSGLSTMSMNLSLSTTTAGVCFGTGTTQPTANDYKLDAMITSGIVATRTICDNYQSYSITNDTGSEITITEVGLIMTDSGCKLNTAGTGLVSASSTNGVLIDRTLLEIPVTIPAGGVGVINYNISFQRT